MPRGPALDNFNLGKKKETIDEENDTADDASTIQSDNSAPIDNEDWESEANDEPSRHWSLFEEKLDESQFYPLSISVDDIIYADTIQGVKDCIKDLFWVGIYLIILVISR